MNSSTNKPKMLVFPSCNAKEKMNIDRTKIEIKNENNEIVKWEPLNDNTSIGCGINSLTFLGIFTREIGVKLANNISFMGTTFAEIMYFLNEIGNNPHNLKEYITDVTTVEKLTDFLNILFSEIPENTCVIAKLNRFTNGLGHTLIFSKQKDGDIDKLYTIDPQNGKIWERNTVTSDEKIFNVWNKNQIISVSLIFVESSPNSHISPTKTKEFLFPQLKRMSLIQHPMTDEEINSWTVLDPTTEDKYDCGLGVLSFFNIIKKKDAERLAKKYNKERIGVNSNEILTLFNKIKPFKSINLVQQYNNDAELINILNNNLVLGSGTIIQIVSRYLSNNQPSGHYVVARKIKDHVFQIFDPQITKLFNSFDEYYKFYHYMTNNHIVIDSILLYYNVGLPIDFRASVQSKDEKRYRTGTFISFKERQSKKNKTIRSTVKGVINTDKIQSIPTELDSLSPFSSLKLNDNTSIGKTNPMEVDLMNVKNITPKMTRKRKYSPSNSVGSHKTKRIRL